MKKIGKILDVIGNFSKWIMIFTGLGIAFIGDNVVGFLMIAIGYIFVLEDKIDKVQDTLKEIKIKE